jgi:hypothetical protein
MAQIVRGSLHPQLERRCYHRVTAECSEGECAAQMGWGQPTDSLPAATGLSCLSSLHRSSLRELLCWRWGRCIGWRYGCRSRSGCGRSRLIGKRISSRVSSSRRVLRPPSGELGGVVHPISDWTIRGGILRPSEALKCLEEPSDIRGGRLWRNALGVC